jgi:hypothetical protein
MTLSVSLFPLNPQAACSDVQDAITLSTSPTTPCGLFTQEYFGPVAQELHGRFVAGGSSTCNASVRQWAHRPEWSVALPQAFCGWQASDSLQVSGAG